MEKLNIQEIRQIQVSILDAVVEFCEKNNIEYFLCGGTLLGAVRHKGYIPWDDDIDIMLQREDYEKLLADFDDPRFSIFSYRTNQKFYYPFYKISDNSTILIEGSVKQIENMGVNIDVFPLDNIPDELKIQRKLFKKEHFWKYTLLLRYHYFTLKKYKVNLTGWKRNVAATIAPFARLFYAYFNVMKVVKKLDVHILKYSKVESDLTARYVWGYGIREVFKSANFDGITKVEFEGKEYNAPVGYDEYLTAVYGDYMSLPPLEKQVSHHSFDVYKR